MHHHLHIFLAEEIEGEPNFIDQYESTKKNIEEADPQQSEGS